MAGRSPHERLYDSISSFLGKKPPSEIPKKWERFSDIAILPSGSFRDEDWEDIVGPDLWKAVARGSDIIRLRTAPLYCAQAEVEAEANTWAKLWKEGEDYSCRP